MKPDTAFNVATNPDSPSDEKFDANSELNKSMITEVIPSAHLSPLIDFMRESFENQEFNKSLAANNVIPFPSKAAREKRDGMQSVVLDDNQVGVLGDYYEKPGQFGFDSMRMMVDQTPILSSVILTRIRQVQRFCRTQESGRGAGFEIRLRDRSANIGTDEKASVQSLQNFFMHCGWESNPRQRAKLKRDNFSSFMSKLTRDSLTLDSCPIETEFKRDRSLGMDGIYAVDGATIRLCTESGYRDNDDIRAIQVVQGQIRSAYTFDDLIYVPRNPRSDVLVGGYGMSETELLIKVVTNLLNAMTYNGKYFDDNAIPKGLLHLSGNYTDQDLTAFKRQWNGMVKGVNNAWSMPVMVSKDQESKAAFEKFGADIDEMAFSKWMTFLTSIVCAVYGIAPDEINFESFSSKSGGLSGANDTEEKLVSSKDKGLHPLLSYFEDVLTDFIVSDFSDKYVFRFTGLDEEDEKQVFERKKLTYTVNELRAEDNKEKIDADWGDAPLNPSLIGAWQAEMQAKNQENQEDYGTPDGNPEEGDDDDEGSPAEDYGDDGRGQEDYGSAPQDNASAGNDQAPPQDQENQFNKSFGLPIFVIEQ